MRNHECSGTYNAIRMVGEFYSFVCGYLSFKESKTVTDNERQEFIEWLIMWTSWSRELFDNKTDKEILSLYERYKNIV